MCGAPQNTQPVQSALYHTEPEDEHAPAPFNADEEEGHEEDYGPLDTPGIDNHGRDTPQEHGSPSFDYHEERRLHLKDEIYFSHRLPRLPPPAIPGASGSYDDKRSGPLSHSYSGGLESMSASFHSAHSAAHSASMAGPSAGASPSAFHPTGPQYQMRNLSLDDGAPAHGAARAQAAAYGQVPGPSAGQGYSQGRSDMASPGSYGTQDPRPTLLHRKEMDSQERLDLQEERREKVLAEHPEQLRMSAMNQPQTQTLGTGPGAAQGQAGANSQPGESCSSIHAQLGQEVFSPARRHPSSLPPPKLVIFDSILPFTTLTPFQALPDALFLFCPSNCGPQCTASPMSSCLIPVVCGRREHQCLRS